VVPVIDAERIELRAFTEAPGNIGETVLIDAQAREEKVGIIRLRPVGVCLIRTLESDVRIAQGIDALPPGFRVR